MQIALPGFVIPYIAVYDPALMLETVPGLTGPAYWADVVYVVFKNARDRPLGRRLGRLLPRAGAVVGAHPRRRGGRLPGGRDQLDRLRRLRARRGLRRPARVAYE